MPPNSVNCELEEAAARLPPRDPAPITDLFSTGANVAPASQQGEDIDVLGVMVGGERWPSP
jgi:hypothetical protein